MSKLTFPITADGLSLDVALTLPSAGLASLHGAGHPLPASIPGKGLIDTGTDITAVAPAIIRQLSIPVHSTRNTTGLGGKVQVRLFRVSLFILDKAQPQLPWFTLSDLLVMELPAPLPVDALIGMDVLRTCKMAVDGPAGRFTLEF